jgi:8-oxo-dGTP pyrophosphatase MutT (NUDIX family)
MGGTGRQLFCIEDEKPLQCAIKEFVEETQLSIPKKLLSIRIQNKKQLSFNRLFNITGKYKKAQFIDDEPITVEWKYIIYFMILNSSEIKSYNFVSKMIDEIGVETEECAWVKCSNIEGNDIPMSNKTKKSL